MRRVARARLRRHDRTIDPGTGRRRRLVGRDAELARLRELLADAATGRGGCVVVDGDEGVGTSALLAELVAVARDAGVTCLEPVELGARPEAPGLTASDRDLALGERLVTTVEAAAAGGPVLVAVDDADRIDRAHLRAVALVAERAPLLPVLVAVASRQSPDLDALPGARLTIAPLTGDAVAELVADAGGDPSDPVYAQAGGNPFWTLRLVEARRRGTPDLAWLDDDEVAALQVAAALGARHRATDLAAVLGCGADAVADRLGGAVAGGVVRIDGDEVVFAHDLVREAVYLDIPRAVRAVLHGEAGEALLRAGGDPRAVARQLAAADDRFDADVLAAAGRAVRTGDPALAAAVLRRAVEAGDDGSLPELVTALVEDGRLDDAEATARDGIDRLADEPVRARLQALAAQIVLSKGGQPRAALELLDAAAASPSLDADERARSLGDACVAALVAGDLPGAASRAARALALERACANRAALVDAWSVRSWLRSFDLDFDGAASDASAAVDAMADDPAARARCAPEFFAGMVALDLGRLDDADAAFAAGRSAATASGAAWQLPLFHWGLGAVRWLDGRWDDAVTEVDTGLTLAGDLGSLLGTPFGRVVLTLVALARDDLPDARRHLDGVDADLARGATAVGGDWHALARALLAEAGGDTAAAAEELAGVVELDVAVGLLNDLGDLVPDAVRLLVACGDPDRARRLVEQVAAAAGNRAHPPLRCALARCRAVLDGDADAADEAVAVARTLGRPLLLADCLADAAVARLRGAAGEAGALLDEALHDYDALGAARPAARALAAARQAGLRTRRAGPRARARTGWDALSRTELDVVRLVAEGLTNQAIGERLYVSRRTVETHVRHALVKLQVSNRVELAAAHRAREG